MDYNSLSGKKYGKMVLTMCNFPCGLSEAKEIAHSRGGMCLSTEYINLCVPMQWMCNKEFDCFKICLVLRRPICNYSRASLRIRSH